MIKVLVFGSSHVAQIATVYADLKLQGLLPANLHIDMISAPGPVLNRLKVLGATLQLIGKPENWPSRIFSADTFDGWYENLRMRMCKISGSIDGRVDLRSYDHVFFLGGHLLLPWANFSRALSKGVFSKACLKQAAQDLVSTSVFYQCLENRDSGVPIICLFEPILSELAPEYISIKAEVGTLMPIVELLIGAVDQMGLEMLPYPVDLLNEAGNAVSGDFHSGKETDFSHLNAAGASYILNSILSKVDGSRDSDSPVPAYS